MAQTQLLKGLSQIAVIEETSQDTLLAGAAADLVMVARDVSVTYEGGPVDNDVLRGDFMQMARSAGAVSGTITFSVPVMGSGAKGTAPLYGEALKACGLLATNTPDTSEEYTPTSVFSGDAGNPGPSYSVHWLNNGALNSIIGAFGNVSMSVEVGQVAMLTFTFQGAYSAYTDSALLAGAAVYDAVIPQTFMGSTVATNFGGAFAVIGCTAFSWDLGNTIALGRDSADTYGHYGARITGHKPTGSMTIEKPLQAAATSDFFAHAVGGVVGTIATGDIGGTDGNKWAFDVRACTVGMPEEGDDNEIMQWTINWAAHNLPTALEATVATAAIALTIK
jgi:hypothetical protein